MASSDDDQELRAFAASLGSGAGSAADQAALFHEPFMSVDPKSVGAVTRDRLREAALMRTRLFASIGAVGTRLGDVATIPLDDHHAIIRAVWDVEFAEPAAEPLQLRSTFLVRREKQHWEVLVYLNHQDIVGIVSARGAGSTLT